MYQNIYIKKHKTHSEVHLWDDTAGYQKFNYKPYAYIKSPSGTYRSLYGDKLKKVNHWTQEDLEAGMYLNLMFHQQQEYWLIDIRIVMKCRLGIKMYFLILKLK